MPRHESGQLRPATKLLHHMDAIDALPVDEETSLVTKDYTQFAEFLAYIKQSNITIAGELQITIAVPYEHKYDAMPLTDMRGVMFVMQAHRPMSEGEREYREQHARETLGIGKGEKVINNGEDNGQGLDPDPEFLDDWIAPNV